ncbi:MAG: hypothetical protein WC831_02750 [Parcubacteria group bacterium]|jgi:hypothetical protein
MRNIDIRSRNAVDSSGVLAITIAGETEGNIAKFRRFLRHLGIKIEIESDQSVLGVAMRLQLDPENVSRQLSEIMNYEA